MNGFTKRVICWLSASIVVLAHANSALAADSFWTAGSGNFTNPANWSAGVPGASDNANFTNNTSYTVTWTSDPTTSNAFFNASTGTVTLDATGHTWTLPIQMILGQLSGSQARANLAGGTITATGGPVPSNTGNLTVGLDGQGFLTISNGARFNSGTTIIGRSSSGNSVIVTDPNSLWVGTCNLDFGYFSGLSHQNTLIITNGAHMGANNINLGGGPASYGNKIIVTGSGSILTNTGTLIMSGDENSLLISKGGQAIGSGNLFLGFFLPVSNVVTVTDAGSLLTRGTIWIGDQGGQGTLIVSNGATARVSSSVQIGLRTFSGSIGRGNVVVTGNESLLQTPNLYVGSNLVSATDNVGIGRVSILNGGTLQANTLVSGFNGTGTITNNGGVYQFTTPTPTITSKSTDSILVTNGTISFRDMGNAPVFQTGTQLTNITYQGNNAYRLNNATNAGISSYTFDSIANTGTPTNYQSLVLLNGGSRWQSTTLNIGSGGALLVTNSSNARVDAVVTNIGSIAVVNSRMTFASNLVIAGSYVSDPSTNIYLADVTVTQSGTLAGGAGDLFDFKKSLYIHSTNNTQFNLRSATVKFSGGGIHTNEITGLDFGTNAVGFADNFAYGRLTLASTNDSVCFGCGNQPPIANNGLYIDWLDLANLTNDIPSVTNLVTNLLHAPANVNLYYLLSTEQPQNAYLGDQIFQLTDCNGNPGGFLMPVIPEPSSIVLIGAGLAGLILRRRR